MFEQSEIIVTEDEYYLEDPSNDFYDLCEELNLKDWDEY